MTQAPIPNIGNYLVALIIFLPAHHSRARWEKKSWNTKETTLPRPHANADCTKTCSKLMAAEHHDALSKHVRLARLGA